MLNGMQPSIGGVTSDRRAIEQYRSLCLLALGRGTEAESAIAAVVTVDPLFVPGESDASPRVRAAFSDVRQRLLPEIARSRYATAKATFDRKEHAAAEREFRDLLALLDDPQMAGRLSDLRVIAAGFLELSAAAAAPPPEPKKEEPAPLPWRRRRRPSRRPRASGRGDDSGVTRAGADPSGDAARPGVHHDPDARSRAARDPDRRAGARDRDHGPQVGPPAVRLAVDGGRARLALPAGHRRRACP